MGLEAGQELCEDIGNVEVEQLYLGASDQVSAEEGAWADGKVHLHIVEQAWRQGLRDALRLHDQWDAAVEDILE